MVDFLKLLQTFEKLELVGLVVKIAQPAYRKVMPFCLYELIVFKGCFDQLNVAFQKLIRQLIVLIKGPLSFGEGGKFLRRLNVVILSFI